MDEGPCKPLITVVPLGDEHIDGLCTVEEKSFSVPWSKESFVSVLSNTLAVFFIGYVGMYQILSEGQITNIAVLPEYRRMGIATELFDRLFEYCKDREVELITLEVRQSNLAAIEFYNKYGFEEVGIRKDYYTCPKENALLMNRQM